MFCLGIIIGRYFISIVDYMLEFINTKITKMTNSIAIETQKEQINFQKEYNIKQEDDPNRIGFEHPGLTYEDNEDNDEDKFRVGFRNDE
jgi:hypothetical protein